MEGNDEKKIHLVVTQSRWRGIGLVLCGFLFVLHFLFMVSHEGEEEREGDCLPPHLA